MKKSLITLTLTALLGSFLQAEPDDHTDHRETDAPRTERPDWDSLKKRIEGAVERGDLTRDQANEKYLEIKKKMGPKRPDQKSAPPLKKAPMRDHARPRDGKPDALGKVLAPLIRQGKLTPGEAAQIRRAAMVGKRPMPPKDHPRRARQHPPISPRSHDRIGTEMHQLLEKARQELAQIHEIRKNLEELRNHRERETAERHLREERRELEKQQQAMEGARREMEKRREQMQRENMEQRKAAEQERREMKERRESQERESKEARERPAPRERRTREEK